MAKFTAKYNFTGNITTVSFVQHTNLAEDLYDFKLPVVCRKFRLETKVCRRFTYNKIYLEISTPKRKNDFPLRYGNYVLLFF